MKVSSSPKEKRRSRSKSRRRKFPVNEPRTLKDNSDRVSDRRSSSRSRALTRALDDSATGRKKRSTSLDSREDGPSTKTASRTRQISPLQGESSHGKSRRSKSSTRIPISSGSSPRQSASSPMQSEDNHSRRRRGTSNSRLPISSPSGKSPIERRGRGGRAVGRRQDMAQQRKHSKLALELAVDHLEQETDQAEVEEAIEQQEKRDHALEKVKALAKSHASNQRAATHMALSSLQNKYHHTNIESTAEPSQSSLASAINRPSGSGGHVIGAFLSELEGVDKRNTRTSAGGDARSRFEDSFDHLNFSSEEACTTKKATKTPTKASKITDLSSASDHDATPPGRRVRVSGRSIRDKKTETKMSPTITSTTIRSSSSSRLDTMESSDNNDRLRSRRSSKPRLPATAPRTGSAPSLSALVADAAALNDRHTKKGTANAVFRRTASREIPMSAAARAKRLQALVG